MHELRSSGPRKTNLFLTLNLILVVALLAAIPLLRFGQENYEPHAVVDKQYVKQVIATGETAEVGTALKLTEISRALAYDDYAQMLTIMQVVAALLAIMVLGNILILNRMTRTEPRPAPVSLKALPSSREMR